MQDFRSFFYNLFTFKNLMEIIQKGNRPTAGKIRPEEPRSGLFLSLSQIQNLTKKPFFCQFFALDFTTTKMYNKSTIEQIRTGSLSGRLRGSDPTSTLEPDLGNANVGIRFAVYRQSVFMRSISVLLFFRPDPKRKECWKNEKQKSTHPG